MLSKLFTSKDVWIGMKYNNLTQTYNWMDGYPVVFTKWLNKKPDPRDGFYVKAGVGNGLRSMFWSAASRAEKHPFFCKKYPGLYCLVFCWWLECNEPLYWKIIRYDWLILIGILFYLESL